MERAEPSGSDAVPTRWAGNFSHPCHAEREAPRAR